METFVKNITPSQAWRVYDKILDSLRKFGYTVKYVSDSLEKVTGRNTITQFTQSYKITDCRTDYGKIFSIVDYAPYLIVNILGYVDNYGNNVYNLHGWLPGTPFDWEGEDSSLTSLVDSFLDDANSDILNSYADAELLVFDEQPVVDRLNEGLINNVNFEKFETQIKESNDSESLAELESKIDIIMNALGLDNSDNDNKNLDNEISDIADTEEKDTIDVVDDEEKEITSSAINGKNNTEKLIEESPTEVDGINFVD